MKKTKILNIMLAVVLVMTLGIFTSINVSATGPTEPAVPENIKITMVNTAQNPTQPKTGAEIPDITVEDGAISNIFTVSTTSNGAKITVTAAEWYIVPPPKSESGEDTDVVVDIAEDPTFLGNAVYKAKLELNLTGEDFDFKGLDANTVTFSGVTGAEVTHAAQNSTATTLAVTITFPKTASGTVTATGATIGDVRISGIAQDTDANATLKKTGVDVTITLTPDTAAGFKGFEVNAKGEVTGAENSYTTNVTTWFKDMPTGLTATVKTIVGNTMTVTIKGTATEDRARGDAIEVKIPAECIAVGNNQGEEAYVNADADEDEDEELLVAATNNAAVWDIVRIVKGSILTSPNDLIPATATSINLMSEKFTPLPESENFTAKLYSLNAGAKWAAVKDALSDAKFPKILNKGATLYITDKDYNKKAKSLDPGATIIQFVTIEKRPKFPKLIINYAAKGLAATTANSSYPGKWTVTEAKTVDAEPADVPLIYGLAGDDKKTVSKDFNSGNYDVFTAATGVEVEKTDELKLEKPKKFVYLFKTAPTENKDNKNVTTSYTPASKLKKLNVLSTLKAPKYTFKPSVKNIFKIKKNTYYGKEGVATLTLTTANTQIDVPTDSNKTKYELWSAATAKKPVSIKTIVDLTYTAPEAPAATTAAQ